MLRIRAGSPSATSSTVGTTCTDRSVGDMRISRLSAVASSTGWLT